MAQYKDCVEGFCSQHFCRLVLRDKRNARDSVDVEGITSVSLKRKVLINFSTFVNISEENSITWRQFSNDTCDWHRLLLLSLSSTTVWLFIFRLMHPRPFSTTRSFLAKSSGGRRCFTLKSTQTAVKWWNLFVDFPEEINLDSLICSACTRLGIFPLNGRWQSL